MTTTMASRRTWYMGGRCVRFGRNYPRVVNNTHPVDFFIDAGAIFLGGRGWLSLSSYLSIEQHYIHALTTPVTQVNTVQGNVEETRDEGGRNNSRRRQCPLPSLSPPSSPLCPPPSSANTRNPAPRAKVTSYNTGVLYVYVHTREKKGTSILGLQLRWHSMWITLVLERCTPTSETLTCDGFEWFVWRPGLLCVT